jgi:hypothetical protein
MIKNYVIIAVMILLAIPEQSSAVNNTASSWYIGFGAGSGIAFGDGKIFHKRGDSIAVPLVLNLGIGASLSKQIFLGFDYISFSHFADQSINGKEETRVLSVDNFFASAMYFPGWERLFLKVAFGWSYLGDWEYNFIDSSATFYGGPGITAGIGYFIPLRDTLNLGLHLEYSREWFNGELFDHTDMAVIYVSLYWF